MATIAELLALSTDWQKADRALADISALRLDVKRAEAYPAILARTAGYFCDADGPSRNGFEVDGLLTFLVRELDVEPTLAAQLYAAMPRTPRFREQRFLRFARTARDPAALPLIRRRWDVMEWPKTVLALDGIALVDDLIDALAEPGEAQDLDLATAAGYYGGARARVALRELYARTERKDLVALGIAFAGDPDDAAWFKALSTQGEGISAKRIHAALAKPKLNDRLAAIDAIPKNLGTAGLIALAKLVSDDEPDVVTHATHHLREYVVGRGERTDNVVFAIFLARAKDAVETGVSIEARKAIDTIQAAIPRSERLPPGPGPKTITAVMPQRRGGFADAPVRKKLPGAKVRGLEMLETLREQVPAKPATARNAALESVIADDPDDIARYLVYADWLQGENDARGLLITLQHAAYLRPGDKARAVAAKAFLDEHRHSLLGRIDPFVRERDLAHVDLDWFMGYIRRAKIRSESAKLMLEVAGYLLESPSAIFLQELVIEAQGALPIDPRRIVDMLLDASSPQTLRAITIGKPGAWKPPPDLVRAFPRLVRDPAVAWADAMVKANEERRLKPEVDAARMPPLVPRIEGIEIDVQAILVGLKAELHKQRPLGVLETMPAVFERDSLDAFAIALADHWERTGENPRWPFDALGPLGGERAVQWIGRRLTGWSYARAAQALGHLVRIGTDSAIYEIITLALEPAGGARRRDAYSSLDVIAKRRALADRDALFDRICPTSSTERVLATQRAWLEYLMLAGHRIPVGDFRQYVAGNGIRLPLAASLLWAECNGERILGLFRLAADGDFVRSTGEPYDLEAEGNSIGLVHPAELDPEEIGRIRDRFGQQAILQLDRPVYWLSAGDAKTDTLTSFEKRRVGFYALQGVLEARGWYAETDDESGGTIAWAKNFPRDSAYAIASLNDTSGSIAEVQVKRHGAYGDALRLDTLHVITISELLWDLETAHTR